MKKSFESLSSKIEHRKEPSRFLIEKENILRARLESQFFQWLLLPESQSYLDAICQQLDSLKNAQDDSKNFPHLHSEQQVLRNETQHVHCQQTSPLCPDGKKIDTLLQTDVQIVSSRLHHPENSTDVLGDIFSPSLLHDTTVSDSRISSFSLRSAPSIQQIIHNPALSKESARRLSSESQENHKTQQRSYTEDPFNGHQKMSPREKFNNFVPKHSRVTNKVTGVRISSFNELSNVQDTEKFNDRHISNHTLLNSNQRTKDAGFNDMDSPHSKTSTMKNSDSPKVHNIHLSVNHPPENTPLGNSGEEISHNCMKRSIETLPWRGPETYMLLEDLQTSFSLVTHSSGLSLLDLECIFRHWLKQSTFLAALVFTELKEENSGCIRLSTLLEYARDHWFLNDMNKTLFYMLSHDSHHQRIYRGDLVRLVQVVAERHGSLHFLENEPEYKKRYVETVVTRMFYTLDSNSHDYITLDDFYHFEMLQQNDTLHVIESLVWDVPNVELNTLTPCTSFPDILSSLDHTSTSYENFFFSYEQFYVIYYLFVQLDTDQDWLLSAEDLLRHDQNGFSLPVLNRILHVLVASKGHSRNEPLQMTYEDFIVFLMNDENKATRRSLKFWFDVMDIDGNGRIMYQEIKYFYDELCQRFDAINQEPVPLDNIICQFCDTMNPHNEGEFTLMDFLRNRKVSGVFFDLLLSQTKGLAYEFRDPYQARQEQDDFPFSSSWDRFALREYCSLMSNQNASDHENDQDHPDVWLDNCSSPPKQDLHDAMVHDAAL